MILSFAEQRLAVRQGVKLGGYRAGEKTPRERDYDLSFRFLVDMKIISGVFAGSEISEGFGKLVRISPSAHFKLFGR